MFTIVMSGDLGRPMVTRVRGLPQAREMWDWLTSLGYEGDPRP